MRFYYISIFTSVIVMGTTTTKALWVFRLVAIAVVLLHILSLSILLAWDNPKSLFGKGGYILNRYSSTHTLHVHKINHVNADAPGSSDPMHWDALGLIIPALDESAQIHRYKIGRTEITANSCEEGALPACLLENNAGDYLLLNGDSLSILSEISPSVYFATLLIVYLLSSVPYVEFAVSSVREMDPSTGKMLRKGLMIVILIVYFCGLLSAYASSPFNDKAYFKEIGQSVYYSTSSHMASILVCLLTVFIYLLHLRGSNSNLYIDVSGLYSAVQQDPIDNHDDTYGPGTPPVTPRVTPRVTPVNGQTIIPIAEVFYADESTPVPIVPIQGLQESTIIPPKSNTQYSNGKTTSVSEQGGGILRRPDREPQRLGARNAFTSSVYGIQILNPSEQSLHSAAGFGSREADGPFSSEASVLISITLFLGGVGNIGMSHGVVLEIETQLVLACTLGFAVLEVCSYRLEAYFFYIFDIILKDSSGGDFLTEKETYFKGIYFIRSVVLGLQLWLLLLYNSTVTEMGYKDSAPERVVFVLTMIYFSLQVLIHLYQIWLFGRSVAIFVLSNYFVGDDKLEWHDMLRRVHYYVELAFLVISFFAIFGALFGYATSNGVHPEGTLEYHEKLQYGGTEGATHNSFCSKPGTYKNVKLIDNELTEIQKSDAKWTGGALDPIDLKVFFWTKYWNLDMRPVSMHSMPLWFCKNGFEHHWMQCLGIDKPLPETVTTAISTGIVKY